MSNLHVLTALFGLLGVFLRFGLDELALRQELPVAAATLFINLLGSFAAGLIFAALGKGLLDPAVARPLLLGFCGGFTTFSALSLQAVLLAGTGRPGLASLYLFGSPALGFGAAWLGTYAGRALPG